jgi:hypothetical protein
MSDIRHIQGPEDHVADDLGLADLQADLAARIVQAFRSVEFRRLLEVGEEISGLEVHTSKATQTF